MELNQLRRRARRHNLRIITDRSTGLYYLVFVGILTLLFGYLERRLNYFK